MSLQLQYQLNEADVQSVLRTENDLRMENIGAGGASIATLPLDAGEFITPIRLTIGDLDVVEHDEQGHPSP